VRRAFVFITPREEEGVFQSRIPKRAFKLYARAREKGIELCRRSARPEEREEKNIPKRSSESV
jgi:hypothetical protein